MKLRTNNLPLGVILTIVFLAMILVSFVATYPASENRSEVSVLTVATINDSPSPSYFSTTSLQTSTPTPYPQTATPFPEPIPTEIVLTPLMSATPDSDGNIYHVVNSTDSLMSIASFYGIPADLLRTNNWMHGNALIPGQKLLIHPGSSWRPEYPWYSRLKGDLVNEMIPSYPLSLKRDRFIIHYIPKTYPAIDPLALAFLFENGLTNAEKIFGRPFNLEFDIFAAGNFFEAPNQYLRGHSFGKDLYLVFLHDGSGDAVDQQYLAAHEITHFYMWNTFGQPYSYLLSEGAAVYSGKEAVQGQGTLPLEEFCKAYDVAGVLPQISDKELTYRGQNNDLENYYAAGCFIQYMVRAYGIEKLGEVYSNGQYESVYGKTLVELEREWRQALRETDMPLSVDPQELIEINSRIKDASQHFFRSYFSAPNYLPAYIALDQARLSLLNGELGKADDFLAQYYAFTGNE